MSRKNQVFGIEDDGRFDTTKFDDTSDATYNFAGRAPRQEVIAAGSAVLSQAEPIWYITRTLKVSPYTTEHASNKYDQIWDDILTIATFA